MSNPLNCTPVDWFNFYGNFASIFAGIRSHNMITRDECALLHPTEPNQNDLNHTTFKHDANTGIVHVLKANHFNFPAGATVSKFMLLSAVSFKFNNSEALSHVMYELMGIQIPYIRVACDYFKVIEKEDRYGAVKTELKTWKKDEIKQDHSKSFLQSIPRYDDFIIKPDNVNFRPVHMNAYNLYSKFAHTPHSKPVTENSIPHSIMFMKHIFGDHFEYGLKYMKILYEHPRQILPILSLVSEERETGKTTFMNWIEMIFGNNFVLISPEDLTKHFNSSFSTKNIIGVEETFLEKQLGVEKLKSLSTGKSITMSQKFISDHSLPFFGKVILCTNKVKDFMKIDNDEIRFWIRRIPSITGKKNTNIENDLFSEIPKFLKYLTQLPAIKFDTGSRMYFTKDEITTAELEVVKSESRSWLFKEIEMFVSDYFDQNETKHSFCATAKDIKEEWFKGDSRIQMSYIRKVLVDEAKMTPKTSPTGKAIKYHRFGRDENGSISFDYRTGMPFEFFRTPQ